LQAGAHTSAQHARSAERGAPRALELALLALALAAIALAWRAFTRLPFTGEDAALLLRAREGLAGGGHVFRPLVDACFTAGHALFGAQSPLPYHAFALGLHVLNAALVHVLARELGLGARRALLAALLFGLGAGVVDGLAWISALNRPLSASGCLLAFLGLARLGRSAGLALVLAGCALQFLANEEVYGTALCAILFLGLHARAAGGHSAVSAERPSARRAALLALVLCAALAWHVLALRGSGGGYLLRAGGWRAALAAAPEHALERLSALLAGYGTAAPLVALAALLGPLGLALAGRRRSAALLVGMFAASFVPFALEGGSRYRDYPTQAPLALLAASAWVPRLRAGALARFEAASAWGLTAALALAIALTSAVPRAASLRAWREATQELGACSAALRALGPLAPGEPAPLLINLDSSAHALVALAARSELALPLPALAFLDSPGACAPPADLDARLATAARVFGRRADGSVGAIDRAELAGRARLAPLRLVEQWRNSDSLAASRALLASRDFELAREAVYEGSERAAQPPSATTAAPGELALLEPAVLDAATLSAKLALEARVVRPALLVVDEPWLHSELLRFSADYAWLARLGDARVVRARARGFALAQPARGGAAQPAFERECAHANAFGFGLPLEPGHWRIELDFRVAAAGELR